MEPGRSCEVALAKRLLGEPVEVLGRFAAASNATLLVRLGAARASGAPGATSAGLPAGGRLAEVDASQAASLAVYKPRRGEAPLRDFPVGTLHRREVAAHEVDRALGWGLVPATVLREDAPLGVGSLQRFVAHDPEQHYFALRDAGDPAVLDRLRTMVVFDLIVDNADRKAGHVLLERPGDADEGADADEAAGAAVGAGGRAGARIRLVDHGVTFNVLQRHRTVAWDFAGESVPAVLLADLDRLRELLAGDLGARLATLLTGEEVAALSRRVGALLASPRLPGPSGPRPYPWPLI